VCQRSLHQEVSLNLDIVLSGRKKGFLSEIPGQCAVLRCAAHGRDRPLWKILEVTDA